MSYRIKSSLKFCFVGGKLEYLKKTHLMNHHTGPPWCTLKCVFSIIPRIKDHVTWEGIEWKSKANQSKRNKYTVVPRTTVLMMKITETSPLSATYFRCVGGVLQPCGHEAVERGRTTEGTPFWLIIEAFEWTVTSSWRHWLKASVRTTMLNSSQDDVHRPFVAWKNIFVRLFFFFLWKTNKRKVLFSWPWLGIQKNPTLFKWKNIFIKDP